MRSFPSCWNKTLTQLGFKRKRRKQNKRADRFSRRSLIESLEPRQMLAADFIVDTLADGINVGGVSLRDALAEATSGETIGFSASLFSNGSGRIVLGDTDGDGTVDGSPTPLNIDKNVEILGPGADQLTIDGKLNSQIFIVQEGFSALLSGLTITGGSTLVNGYQYGSGGGIQNLGDLTLENSVLTENEAFHGGAIYVGTNASLTLVNSTIDNNHATSRGGGIRINADGGKDVSIISSTISNNTAAGLGGGIDLKGAIAPDITITNSTFSGNDANIGGAITANSSAANLTIVNTTITDNHGVQSSGGIKTHAATTLHNSILAGNTSGHSSYVDSWGDLSGTGSSYNLIGIGSGNIVLTHNDDGNMIGTTSEPIDPKLSELGYYGGQTKTHALLEGSDAIDRGDQASSSVAHNGGCLAVGSANINWQEINRCAVDMVAAQQCAIGP